MNNNREYLIWSKLNISGSIIADNPDKALDKILNENNMKYVGYMRVSEPELANLQVIDMNNRYLYHVQVEVPNYRVYQINIVSNHSIFEDITVFNTCFTTCKGKLIELLSNLINIHNTYIKATSIYNTYAQIHVMDLRNGRKYGYHVDYEPVMKMLYGRDDLDNLNKLVIKNTSVSFPKMTKLLLSDPKNQLNIQ